MTQAQEGAERGRERTAGDGDNGGDEAVTAGQCCQFCCGPICFATLLGGIALNAVVLATCSFFELQQPGAVVPTAEQQQRDEQTATATLGLFGYRPPGSTGSCTSYTMEINDPFVKTARAGSIVSVVLASLAFLLLLNRRNRCCGALCCCHLLEDRTCESFLINSTFILVEIFASLTWLVLHNAACESGRCGWGTGATLQLISQCLYLVAGLLTPLVPDHTTKFVNQGTAKKKDDDDDGDSENDDNDNDGA